MTVENTGGQENTPTIEELNTARSTAWESYQSSPSDESKQAYLDADKKTSEFYAKELKTRDEKLAGYKTPDKYDLKKPEKSILSDEHVGKIAEYAKTHGLSQKQAEAQLERENQVLSEARQAYEAESQAKMAEVQESWITTAKDDKEYGGAEFAKNTELAKRVLAKYGTPEFNAILDDPKQGRFGNHPELMRVLYRIGKAMSEDQLIMPGAQGSKKSPVSAAEKLYGEGTVKTSGVQAS